MIQEVSIPSTFAQPVGIIGWRSIRHAHAGSHIGVRKFVRLAMPLDIDTPFRRFEALQCVEVLTNDCISNSDNPISFTNGK